MGGFGFGFRCVIVFVWVVIFCFRGLGRGMGVLRYLRFFFGGDRRCEVGGGILYGIR